MLCTCRDCKDTSSYEISTLCIRKNELDRGRAGEFWQKPQPMWQNHDLPSSVSLSIHRSTCGGVVRLFPKFSHLMEAHFLHRKTQNCQTPVTHLCAAPSSINLSGCKLGETDTRLKLTDSVRASIQNPIRRTSSIPKRVTSSLVVVLNQPFEIIEFSEISKRLYSLIAAILESSRI